MISKETTDSGTGYGTSYYCRL